MISEIIINAAFCEHELDLATGGLCGTFALALADTCSVETFLLCLSGKDGTVATAADGQPYWRHVVCKCGDDLFDMDGRVLLEHIVENYCWGNPYGDGGQLVPITRADLEALLKSDAKSYDKPAYDRWSSALAASMQQQGLQTSDANDTSASMTARL